MSLTTTDKQEIKVMIKEGTAHLVTTSFVKNEIYRLETLLEHTDSNVSVMLGMLSDNLKVKSHVDNHEVRLTDVETKQPIIISTLALHSKRHKTL